MDREDAAPATVSAGPSSNGDPLLSVVIPCHNGRVFLVECLSSISRLKGAAYEVVVVDDGSTEDVRTVVEGVSPRVRYVWQSKQGPAAARNRGLSESTGRYVWFLDSDDTLLEPDVLTEQIALLDAHPTIGMVHAKALTVDHEGRPFAVQEPPSVRNSYVRSGEDELARLLLGNYITTSTVLARRSVLNRIGPWRTDLIGPEDWEYWLRIARVSSIAYVHRPLIAYRIHGASITARYRTADWHRMHRTILDNVFADPDVARRYARLRTKIDVHLLAATAGVAYQSWDRDAACSYARQGFWRSVAVAEWRPATACAWLLIKSLAPAALRRYGHPLSRQVRIRLMAARLRRRPGHSRQVVPSTVQVGR